MRAQTLAVFSTQRHIGQIDQHGSPKDRLEIELVALGKIVELVFIHIFGRFRFARNNKIRLKLTIHIVFDFVEAARAFGRNNTGDGARNKQGTANIAHKSVPLHGANRFVMVGAEVKLAHVIGSLERRALRRGEELCRNVYDQRIISHGRSH